jgi:hypothetical protein
MHQAAAAEQQQHLGLHGAPPHAVPPPAALAAAAAPPAPGVSSLAARVPAFSCPPLDVTAAAEGGSVPSPGVGGLGLDSFTPDSLSPNSGCTVVSGVPCPGTPGTPVRACADTSLARPLRMRPAAQPLWRGQLDAPRCCGPR